MNRILILSSLLCCAMLGCAKEPPMTGAYATAVANDADVLAAADFAVKAQGKTVQLVKVLSAEKQVVAGMNYRMKLAVSVNGVPRKADVVVWHQAWQKKNPYQLTSWEWQK